MDILWASAWIFHRPMCEVRIKKKVRTDRRSNILLAAAAAVKALEERVFAAISGTAGTFPSHFPINITRNHPSPLYARDNVSGAAIIFFFSLRQG
jgi:hypothetical protein